MTPLCIAVAKNDSSMVRLFLDAGAELNTPRNASPLAQAAFFGSLDVMKILMERGADPSSAMVYSSESVTAMEMAAAGGCADAINILRNAGASVTASQSAFLPIHAAAIYGQPDAVAALLASNADVNSIDDGGWTPLHYSCWERERGGNLKISPVVPFICDPKHHEATKALIRGGANVSARAEEGCTPIFVAARWGYVDAINSLLDSGADVSARSKTGQTPLFMAATGGHVETINSLISAGASVKARDDEGRTAVFLAAEGGFIRAIEKLHELGADLSSRDDRGCTPLFVAADEFHVTAVEKLIELGADPSCLNYRGETPWSYVKRHSSSPPPELKVALSRKRVNRESSSGFWKGVLGRKNK
jgi:ankyrin repeat protein